MPRPRAAVAALFLALALALPACGSAAPGDLRSGTPPAGPEGPPHEQHGEGCEYSLTDFPGDCQAPPAIDPSEGVLVHYGPSDYTDPDEVLGYLVYPGEEPVDCGYTKLPNDADVFYNRYDVYSRPGMHHVILSALAADVPGGTHDDCESRYGGASLLAVFQGGIHGSVYHYPPSGEIAPENANIATKLGAHQSVAYELHAVNTTDYPLLRENWTVFHTMPADEVEEIAGQMAFNGGLGMNIEPHTRQTITNQCLPPPSFGEFRILDFYGHMHSHGERFSAFLVHPDGAGGETRTLVYESYDWSLLDLIEFNTVKENAPVDYAGGVPGGSSGPLILVPGDRLDYECDMNNTEDYALRFKARAFEGEMCNLFGSFAPGTYWTCVGN